MKHATDCAAHLTKLLSRLMNQHPLPEQEQPADPIAVLIHSFLLWEATSDQAAAAMQKLTGHVVDYNDLRVCLPHETVELIGSRYPRALDRCQRLRAVLNDIYRREHAVRLDSLREQGKRDVKKYTETLEGVVPYVSARLQLLCFDTHAIPVDDQLRAYLIEEGAADVSAELVEFSGWLARHIKADDGLAAHHALQRWVDAKAGGSRSTPRSRKAVQAKPRGGGKKSEGKSTARSRGAAK